MASPEPLTPMMAQDRRIKGELPKDALLLFRLGDFYEMLFANAQVGAQLLNVALTKRVMGSVPRIVIFAASFLTTADTNREGALGGKACGTL